MRRLADAGVYVRLREHELMSRHTRSLLVKQNAIDASIQSFVQHRYWKGDFGMHRDTGRVCGPAMMGVSGFVEALQARRPAFR